MYTYETHIRPYSDRFVRIKLSNNEIKKAFKWALEMTEAKDIEMTIARDNASAFKRLANGMIGEMAIEKFFQTTFIDWTIGQSKDYSRPDLISIGHSIGVKTVEYGKFPVIPKINYYPQIINIYRAGDQVCFICGLASPEVLNSFQTTDLIVSNSLKRKGTKTAFYGFDHLTDPKSIITI
jgi:hypothetical protein